MNKTKIILNSNIDISSYITGWFIYIQPLGYDLILMYKDNDLSILRTIIDKIQYIEFSKKSTTVKLKSNQKPIITYNPDNSIEIWMMGGDLT